MKFIVDTKRFKLKQTKSRAFNTDTILLSNFIKIPKGCKNILDVGTGSGVLMIDMAMRSNSLVYGIEVQSERYLNALENVELNNLNNKAIPLLGDFKNYEFDVLFDMIISNPPFFKVLDNHRLSKNEEDMIARHEVLLNLDELVGSVSKNLKYRGTFYLVHRPDRLHEIISVLDKYNIVIKEIRFVHPYLKKDANHVLIKGVKNGSPGMKVLNPLILYEDRHVFTKELESIIGEF